MFKRSDVPQVRARFLGANLGAAESNQAADGPFGPSPCRAFPDQPTRSSVMIFEYQRRARPARQGKNL